MTGGHAGAFGAGVPPTNPMISAAWRWSRACIPLSPHDATPHARRGTRAPPLRLRRHDPGVCRPAIAQRRDTTGGPDPRSATDRARDAVPRDDADVGLQDRIRRGPHEQGQRLEHAADHVALPPLQPLRHRGRARGADRRAHGDDRARAGAPDAPTRAPVGAARAGVGGCLARDPGPGARGRQVRGGAAEADEDVLGRGLLRGARPLPPPWRPRLVRRRHLRANGGCGHAAGGVRGDGVRLGRGRAAAARDPGLAGPHVRRRRVCRAGPSPVVTSRVRRHPDR